MVSLRGLSPITLDESSTSCFVLSGSEPNLLNRGLLPITLDESSASPLIVCSLVGLISILTEFEAYSPLFNRFGSDPDKTKQEVDDSSKVIGDSPLFEKFSSDTDMEVDDLSKIGDNSPPLKGLSPITLDESSTSCFVLSGSEPNLLNRGLLPITLDESSTSCFIRPK
jgi:hypothetical protein